MFSGTNYQFEFFGQTGTFRQTGTCGRMTQKLYEKKCCKIFLLYKSLFLVKSKREKLLCDNPNALVKFNTVGRRIQNPKYAHMNSIQSNRLHRIKYRLATIPPIRYLANNVVESKFFKNAISYIGKNTDTSK